MSAQPASSAPLSGRRVLVLEDEYFLADDITRSLERLGARIIGPAGDLKEALSLVDGDISIDAAVLDINLRSHPVFPLARLLRARNVPFLFTTGYDRSCVDPEFQDVGLWAKPLDIAGMAQELVALIGKHPVTG